MAEKKIASIGALTGAFIAPPASFRASACAAISVTASRPGTRRASISARSGVPWQIAVAASRADGLQGAGHAACYRAGSAWEQGRG